MKIYSAIYNIFHPFSTMYPDATLEIVREGTKIDHRESGFVIIHGGSDIHPSLYGRDNLASHVGKTPSPRDMFEAKVCAEAIQCGLPIVGICRGAQLGCALSGGILVQDVDGHGWGSHRIVLRDGEIILTNSIHHQMMYPWGIEHQLLGWSAIPKATHYRGLTDAELEHWPKREYDSGMGPSEGFIEPEIVWFPTTKCLAIQGHPEMLPASDPLNRHVKDLINAYCLNS